MSKKSPYVRLKWLSEWAAQYLVTTELLEQKKYSTKDRWGGLPRPPLEDGLRFTDGQEVGIEWPDGARQTVKLVVTPRSVSYPDHGHTYWSEYETVQFETVNHGVKTMVDITDVAVKRSDLPPPGRRVRRRGSKKRVC